MHALLAWRPPPGNRQTAQTQRLQRPNPPQKIKPNPNPLKCSFSTGPKDSGTRPGPAQAQHPQPNVSTTYTVSVRIVCDQCRLDLCAQEPNGPCTKPNHFLEEAHLTKLGVAKISVQNCRRP